MKTLFLSASTGGGHDKAAEAVMECIRRRNPGAGILLSNSLNNISPVYNKLVVNTYLRTVKNTPGVYGSLYRLSEVNVSITDITKSFNRLFTHRLSKIINAASPSIIVSTHTMPLQMVSALKRKGLHIPAIGIVTDYTNHYFWKLDNIDAFIVANECIKTDMVNMGIPGNRIYTFGIPVSSSFIHRKSKRLLRAELGLGSEPVILLMGGSLGLGEIKNVFSALLHCKRNIQIIAVTGRNTCLKNQLDGAAASTNKNVRIYSFTDKISDLMDASDVIITKPGGVSIAEALIKQLPIIIMSPLPGQEERNANFLMNNGAASRLYPGDNIENILGQILDNPIRLRHMKEMSAHLARPDAAENIVLLMENLVNVYAQAGIINAHALTHTSTYAHTNANAHAFTLTSTYANTHAGNQPIANNGLFQMPPISPKAAKTYD